MHKQVELRIRVEGAIGTTNPDVVVTTVGECIDDKAFTGNARIGRVSDHAGNLRG